MRALFAITTAFLALLFWGHGPSRAALDISGRPHSMELLVFEHTSCVYCYVFRRDVVPRYQHSTAAQVPLRFIDIEKTDTTGLGLKSRIDTLPTAVLMKEGHEVDRISGYWAPDTFFKMLSAMRARAE
jgi:thioredoxin-related protein